MTFSSVPLLVSCALIAGWVAMTPARAADSKDFSAAEQALFVDNHLVKVKPPLTLHFDFRKSGSLEESFNDKIDVALGAQSDGACCTSSASFMTGTHKVPQPEVDGAKANPAILYFLERDIQEMERLTKGKANYFRKRIRMAVFQGAVIRDVTLPYRGKPVAVREISIAPYVDDPNRPRYERLANKRYVFLLASDVPGGLYGIRTRIDGASAEAPPLMEEEMLLAGTDTAPVKRQP
ncbi:MAG: hypothetical protein ABIV63_01405 [Caldimonas sp.]